MMEICEDVPRSYWYVSARLNENGEHEYIGSDGGYTSDLESATLFTLGDLEQLRSKDGMIKKVKLDEEGHLIFM